MHPALKFILLFAIFPFVLSALFSLVMPKIFAVMLNTYVLIGVFIYNHCVNTVKLNIRNFNTLVATLFLWLIASAVGGKISEKFLVKWLLK